jgi:hypothetical protein
VISALDAAAISTPACLHTPLTPATALSSAAAAAESRVSAPPAQFSRHFFILSRRMSDLCIRV